MDENKANEEQGELSETEQSLEEPERVEKKRRTYRGKKKVDRSHKA